MPPPPPDRGTLVRRVLAGLLIANLAVVGAKFAIGLLSGSLAILGDTVHSTVDALNNVFALFVVRIASKGPDEDHPYGHGKFETLGALAIVGFMLVTCFEVIQEAVRSLLTGGREVRIGNTALAVLVATLAINVLVAWYETKRGRELDSDILLADAAHTRADVFVTTGVVIGMFFARGGLWWMDPALAILITAFILTIAYRILVRSVPVLVDKGAVPAGTIRTSAEAVRGVRSAYHIRSRTGAQVRYAEVTIAVDGRTDVETAHQIADQVEQRLKDDLALQEVVVHVEPS